jgi:hypothetical protein
LGVASVPGFDGLAEDLNEFVQAILGTQDVINSNTDLFNDDEFFHVMCTISSCIYFT